MLSLDLSVNCINALPQNSRIVSVEQFRQNTRTTPTGKKNISTYFQNFESDSAEHQNSRTATADYQNFRKVERLNSEGEQFQ